MDTEVWIASTPKGVWQSISTSSREANEVSDVAIQSSAIRLNEVVAQKVYVSIIAEGVCCLMILW